MGSPGACTDVQGVIQTVATPLGHAVSYGGFSLQASDCEADPPATALHAWCENEDSVRRDLGRGLCRRGPFPLSRFFGLAVRVRSRPRAPEL